MSSDNGKPGRLDMFDVWAAMSYIESHYHGAMQLLMERAAPGPTAPLLCSLTFVPNDGTTQCGAGFLLEVSYSPSNLLKLPQLLHDAVLELHETLDDAPAPGLLFGIRTY